MWFLHLNFVYKLSPQASDVTNLWKEIKAQQHKKRIYKVPGSHVKK